MEFKVQKEVLDSGVKIVFAAVEGMDNHGLKASLLLALTTWTKLRAMSHFALQTERKNMFRWVSLSLWRWLPMNTATAMIPTRCFADRKFVR